MPPPHMKKLPVNFVLRSFQPSDQADCYLLEQRANQHRNPKFQKIPILKQLLGTLQVYPHCPKGLETRAKLLSQEYEIIVCEDTAVKRVVAIVVCHISQVSFSSSTDEKVGWVHGLRVDELYQRRGLGTALQQELERRCLMRHINMLYLTVNNNNDKAKSLYQALSYQHASHRLSSTKFLMKVKHFDDDGDMLVIRLTNANLATAITAQHYKDCDLCPVPAAANRKRKSLDMVQDGFIELFQTPEKMYEGTFVAVKRSELPDSCLQLLDSEISTEQHLLLHEVLKIAICQQESLKNYGFISLWSSSVVKGFKVVRLGVTKETWLSPWFQSVLMLSITAILSVWSKRVIGSVISAAATGWRWSNQTTNENPETELSSGRMMTLLWFILGVTEFLLLCLAIRLTVKAYKVFRFVISRNSNKLQSRAFAPSHAGPEGLDCLRAAVVASQVHAQRKGFALWVLNVAEDSKYANKFGKGFKTQFWQKWLVKGGEEGQRGMDDDGLASTLWKPFSAGAFCDPRHF